MQIFNRVMREQRSGSTNCNSISKFFFSLRLLKSNKIKVLFSGFMWNFRKIAKIKHHPQESIWTHFIRILTISWHLKGPHWRAALTDSPVMLSMFCHLPDQSLIPNVSSAKKLWSLLVFEKTWLMTNIWNQYTFTGKIKNCLEFLHKSLFKWL